MARLTIGFGAQGLNVLKAVGDGLDKIAEAATKAGAASKGPNSAFSSITKTAQTAGAALKQLVQAQEQAATSMAGLVVALNSVSTHSNKFLTIARETAAATKAIGTAAATTRGMFSDFVLGQGQAAVALQHLTKETYQSIAAQQAEAAALGKLEALHQSYVGALARQIVAKDAAAASIQAGIAAINREIGAEERLVAARKGLAEGANRSLILSEERLASARQALASGAATGAIVAEERLAAARQALATGASQAAIVSEERLAAARQSLAAGAATGAIVAEERLAAARQALAAGASQAAIMNEERLATARKALATGAAQGVIAAEERLAAAREALATGASQALIMNEERLAAARQALATGANRALIASEERVAAARAALRAGDYAAQIRAEAGHSDRAAASVRKLAGAHGDLHSVLRGVSGAMGGLWMTYGSVIPLMAGFAATAGTIKSIKLGSEFDATTRAVQFLNTELTGTTKPLQSIQESLLDLRDSVRTPQELAEGLLEFTRAGVGVDEVFKSIKGGSTVFEEMVRFSTYAGTSMGATIKLVTGQAASFNTTFTEVANVIAKTADLSTADISTMGEAFKNTTQLGTVLGVSFREVAASLGVMHDNGIRGATAGAALTTAMIRIADPSKKAQKILSEVNAEFSAFEEGSGKLKSIPAIFEDLAKATNNMNPQQFIDFMDELVGKRGVKAAGVLTKEAADDVEAGLDKMRESFGGSSEEFGKFSEGIQAYLSQFPAAVGEGATSFTYLQAVIEAMSASGQYQLKMLKSDIDRLFIESYDNSSVVEEIKRLREVVNDPSTKQGLSDLITLTTKLLGLSVRIGGGIAGGVLNKVEQVENLFGGADLKTISQYEEQIKKTGETVANVKKMIAGGGYESDAAGNKALADAEAAYNAATFGLEGLKIAQTAATNAGKSFENQMGSSSKSTRGAADALVQAENNFVKIKKAAADATTPAYDKVLKAMNDDIAKQTDLINQSSLSQADKNAKIAEYTAYARDAYGPQMEAAKAKDAKLTVDQKNALGEQAAAQRAAKEALDATRSSITVYTEELKRNNEAMQTNVAFALKSAEAMKAMNEKYETAGMSEVQKLQHGINKELEDGESVVRKFSWALEESHGNVVKQTAAYDEAKRKLAAWQEELGRNPKIGTSDEAVAKTKELEEQVRLTGKLASSAIAAELQLKDQADAASTALARQRYELTGTRAAWEEWGNRIIKDAELTGSFWDGMQAGAVKMTMAFDTMGKLGMKAFDGIVDAGRAAAGETADLVFDMLTGKSDEAVDELKKQYDENIANLEESLREGSMTEEEFQKERLELTNQYNEDIKEAHKGLWESITEIMNNLWENILKNMLQIFIQWVAELAMIWAAKQIFSGTSMESWANSLGKVGSSFLSGSGGDSGGYGAAAAGIGAASMAYDYYDSLDSVNQGGYGAPGAFSYDPATGQVGGNEFNVGDAYTVGKTGYDYYNAKLLGTSTPTVSGMSALGGAAGMAGGAYGLYGAAQQLADGTADWKTAVQGALSAWSMYKGYGTVAAYMSQNGMTGMAGLGEAISAGVSEGITAIGNGASGLFGGTAAAATGTTGAGIGIGASYAGTAATAGASTSLTGATWGYGGYGATQAGAYTGIGTAGGGSAPAAGGAAVGAGAALGYAAAAMAAIYYASQNKDPKYGYASPTLGITVPVEYGEDQLSAVRRGGANYGDRVSNTMAFVGLGQGGDDGTGSSYEEARAIVAEGRLMMDGYIDILANDFGDAIAKAGQQLDGSAESVDRFLDSVTGYDVSMGQSTAIMDMAKGVASGTGVTFQELRNTLEAMGMTTVEAETAATALVAGVDGVTSAMSNMNDAASGSWSYIDTETGALIEVGNAAAQSAGHVAGMTAAISEFSSTPLSINVRVNGSPSASMTAVDHQSNLPGVTNSRAALNAFDYYQFNADGGIFTGATLLGGRNIVAEAGAEAVLPLHAGPRTLEVMHDDIRTLIDRPIVVKIEGDAAGLSRFIKVSVDKEVTSQARRGQLSNRTAY